ncbi:MAG: RagB/SusD family nutrient uptake outer membrane protein [Bacteroidaceae bacterium]|nr:RagB/SusD family nutrient uptake outer membrane protein [Bacteroidaceae bacterium]
MKNMKKYLLHSLMGVFAMASLTGCLQETFPEGSTVTETQVKTNPSATESLVLGLPAQFNSVWASDRHNTYGYAGLMRIRDEYTQDLCVGGDLGYSWYGNYGENTYQGEDYILAQYVWNYYWTFVKGANTILSTLPEVNESSDAQKGYRAIALAYRAMLFLDLARMYEFLPNDKVDGLNPLTGNRVDSLTVPIIKHDITVEQARNNPRVKRAEMAAFIEEDLQEAEKLMDFVPATLVDPTLPDKACVYGLYARLYMWIESYAKAETYARKAIDASSVGIMDQNTWLDPINGFNQASQFMWAATQNSETGTVQTGIINFTSWMSNQTTFGYTGSATGMYTVMDSLVYARISDTDFRKLAWKAPAGSPLDGMNDYCPTMDAKEKAAMVNFAQLKFRPAQGNGTDYQTGAAAAYPIMRVEEMYFIEAEAAAHTNPGKGLALLKDFMSNRDAQYSPQVSDMASVVEEIVFQKRIELWGEGQTFFDIKRLNYSVTRGYKGTNHAEKERLNTQGRPAWMNLVIVRTEQNNNEGILGWNSPDPSDAYTPWVEE